MAKVLNITKDDTKESIRLKMKTLDQKTSENGKGFPAHKFTGKITSFGNGITYQRKIRDEWK